MLFGECHTQARVDCIDKAQGTRHKAQACANVDRTDNLIVELPQSIVKLTNLHSLNCSLNAVVSYNKSTDMYVLGAHFLRCDKGPKKLWSGLTVVVFVEAVHASQALCRCTRRVRSGFGVTEDTHAAWTLIIKAACA